jgi:VanZ family protein
MGLIFFASSVPGDEITIHVWDKLLHLTVYAALGFFFLLPVTDGRWSKLTGWTVAIAVALATLYGLTDEFHQNFTPDRTPDVKDLLADALGATIGAGSMLVLKWLVDFWRSRRRLSDGTRTRRTAE